MMKLEIVTYNEIVGFHHWEQAFENVLFLKNRHRHVFTIRCFISVTHDDREKEIFTEEEKIERYLCAKYGSPCEFGNMSCESIARELLSFLDANAVEVLEDERGGAKITR